MITDIIRQELLKQNIILTNPMMTNVVGSQFDKVTQYYLVYQECHLATLVEYHTNYQYQQLDCTATTHQ